MFERRTSSEASVACRARAQLEEIGAELTGDALPPPICGDGKALDLRCVRCKTEYAEADAFICGLGDENQPCCSVGRLKNLLPG